LSKLRVSENDPAMDAAVKSSQDSPLVKAMRLAGRMLVLVPLQ
jgi:hypothetical protein